MKESKLDQMFATVRETPSEQTFHSTSRRFLKAKGVGLIGVALILWGTLSNPLKLMIMISTLLTAGAITTAILLNNTPESNAIPKSNQESMQFENKEIVVDEEGNRTITYFDDANNVIRNETILNRNQRIPLEQMTLLPIEKLEESENLQLKSRIPDRKTLNDTTENVRTFLIDRNMMDTDLMLIHEKATAAGIEFNYSIIVWKGKTKRIRFSLNLKRGDTTCEYNSELKGNFSKTIGWVEDADGKALRLLD